MLHAEGGQSQQNPAEKGVDGADGKSQGQGDEPQDEGVAIGLDAFSHGEMVPPKMQKKPMPFCNQNAEVISFKERFQRVLWEYLIPNSL